MVEIWGTGNWQCVAEFFNSRSDVQCQHRWEKFLSPEIVKGSWTKEARTTNIIFLWFCILWLSRLPLNQYMYVIINVRSGML